MSRKLIFLVIFLSLSLRLWGVGFGLPYIQHSVEGAQSEIYTWPQDFIESLEANYRLIAEFVPGIEFRYEPHVVRMDYEALDRVDLLDPSLMFGSRISVYSRK